MALDATASGVFPIAPTAFHPDGRLDEASIDTLIAGYLKAGSTGVTVLGIMGEAPKLELEESISIAARFIKGFGKLPVIVGVSAPGFAAMRTLSRSVMEKGAAGVMIAPVPSLRTDDQVTACCRRRKSAFFWRQIGEAPRGRYSIGRYSRYINFFQLKCIGKQNFAELAPLHRPQAWINLRCSPDRRLIRNAEVQDCALPYAGEFCRSIGRKPTMIAIFMRRREAAQKSQV
jgi:hypothetical protein